MKTLLLSSGVCALACALTGCPAPVTPPTADASTPEADGGARLDAPGRDVLDSAVVLDVAADVGADAADCDVDGDGFDATACGGSDCDDGDALRYPGNVERCDGLLTDGRAAAAHDEDCEPCTVAGASGSDGDVDADLHPASTCENPWTGSTVPLGCDAATTTIDAIARTVRGDDCDDARSDVYRGLLEACDARDNDCDGAIDEGARVTFFRDFDGDGYGSAASGTALECGLPTGYSTLPSDCDDGAAGVHPGAGEVCDTIDQDCSSGGAPDASEDADGDGHAAAGLTTCAGGYPRDDCDDSHAAVFPGAPERCDGLIDDCSSIGARAEEDADGDGHTALGYAGCAGGFAADDCDDARSDTFAGAPEACDARDTDCSMGGGADASEDRDGDAHTALGFVGCSGGYPADDCDDARSDVFPGAPVPASPHTLAPANGVATGSVHAIPEARALRPRFRWTASSCEAATYELEVDDSCVTPGFATCAFASPEIATRTMALEHTPPADLPVSSARPVGRRYYWRVRSCVGATCSAWSAVRYVDVGRVATDYDGDGWGEVVVGAPSRTVGGFFTGAVDVFSGTSAGPAATPAITLTSPGTPDGAEFGRSVASAGDVNADGFADLVVGAPGEGAAFVYLGGPRGVSTVPANRFDEGASVRDQFGVSTRSAGDLDGDGYAEVVVGAPVMQYVSTRYSGTVFVYRGGSSGASSAGCVLRGPTGPLSGATAMGTSVGPAGDVDADGLTDLAVAAPIIGRGALLVYSGAESFCGSSLGPPPTRVIVNPDTPAYAGGGYFGAALGSGDLDGDARSDLVVGESGGLVPDPPYEGRVLIYLGADAASGAPSVTLPNSGSRAFGMFGASVALGDVNLDGLDDLVVGAPQEGTGAFGAVYFFPGRVGGPSTTPTVTLESPPIAAGGFGWAIALEDVSGDGRRDLLSAGRGTALVFLGSAAGPSSSFVTLTSPNSVTIAMLSVRRWLGGSALSVETGSK